MRSSASVTASRPLQRVVEAGLHDGDTGAGAGDRVVERRPLEMPIDQRRHRAPGRGREEHDEVGRGVLADERDGVAVADAEIVEHVGDARSALVDLPPAQPLVPHLEREPVGVVLGVLADDGGERAFVALACSHEPRQRAGGRARKRAQRRADQRVPVRIAGALDDVDRGAAERAQDVPGPAHAGPRLRAGLVDAHARQLDGGEKAALARAGVDAHGGGPRPHVARVLGGVGRELLRQVLGDGVSEDDPLATVVAEEVLVAVPEQGGDVVHLLGMGEVVADAHQPGMHVDGVLVLVVVGQAAHPGDDVIREEGAGHQGLHELVVRR